MAYQRLAQLATDTEWNDHTHLVIEELEKARVALLAADSMRRSYRISFDTADRDRMEARIAEANELIDRVGWLTRDNPSQQVRVATIRPMIEEREVILRTGLELPHMELLPEPARDEQRTIQARGLTIAKDMRDVFEAMLAEEVRLLGEREARALATARSARIAILVGGASGLVLVALFYISLHRENRRRIVAQDALERSTALISAVIEGTTDPIAVKDRAGHYLLANRAAATYLRRSVAEVVGKTDAEMMSSVAAETVTRNDREIMSTGQARVVEQHLVNDGEAITFLSAKSPHRDAAGEITGVIVVSRDITERKQLELKLAEQNAERGRIIAKLERQSAEVTALSEMGALLQATGTEAEAFVLIGHYAMQLFTRSGGLSVMAPSRNIVETVATWGEAALPPSFAPTECWALRTGQSHLSSVKGSVRCAHLGAGERPAQCIPLVAQGETRGVVYLLDEPRAEDSPAFLAAFTEHLSLALANIQLRETLRAQAIRDPLTGLFNRRYMDETLTREISRARRRDAPVSVVMIDLDHFKRFNDTYGHPAGDALLKHFAEVLRAAVRREDIACRYGGEEFAVILPEAPLDKARARAEEWRVAVERMTVSEGETVIGPVSASLGVASFPAHGATGAEVLKVADLALYRAKKEGRNRVVMADGV